MGKWKFWLLIALGILASLVAGPLLGRNGWTATTTPVGSAAPSSATQERAMNDVCRFDTSGHKVSFVTVEPGVELEVLDWGGTGETLVLLTGGETTRTFTISLHTSSPIVSMSSASRVEVSGAQASLRTAMTLTRERATTSQSSTS
jgi:hypothetical protein